MNLKNFNEAFKRVWESSTKDNSNVVVSQKQALKNKLSESVDRNANYMSHVEKFQRIIEESFPDKSWWEVTRCNISESLFNTQDPNATINEIVEGFLPGIDESYNEYGEPERCEECGTLLNDAGNCPVCDYGDEEARDEYESLKRESLNDKRQGFSIKPDTKHGGFNTYDQNSELLDSGFKTKEDAQKSINKWIKENPLKESTNSSDIRKAILVVRKKAQDLFNEIEELPESAIDLLDLGSFYYELDDMIREVTDFLSHYNESFSEATQKRVAHTGEFNNGFVIRNDWKEMSNDDANELARQNSIKDPKHIHYVQNDDIMNPTNDDRWVKGKKYHFSKVKQTADGPVIHESKESLKESEQLSTRAVNKKIWSIIKNSDRLTDDNSGYYEFDRGVMEGDDAKLVSSLKQIPRSAKYKFSLLDINIDIGFYFDWDEYTWYVIINEPKQLSESNDTTLKESEEPKKVATNAKGEYLVASDSGKGFTAFNKQGTYIGGITSENEQEAKSKFMSGKFDDDANGEITESTSVLKKNNKGAKKKLTEGIGAGYEISGELTDVVIDTAEIVSQNEYGISVKLNGHGKITDVTAESYYYGANIDGYINVDILEAEFEFENDDEVDFSNLNKLVAESLSDTSFEVRFGGGYTHITFDGTLNCMDVYNSNYLASVLMKINSENVIQGINSIITGDAIEGEYIVHDENDDIVDAFSEKDDAILFAKRNDYAKVTLDTYTFGFITADGDSIDIEREYYDSEDVWNR